MFCFVFTFSMLYVRSKHEMLQLIVIGCLSVFPHFAYSSYNIALRKPASQSTEYGGWTADKAVDGVIAKDLESFGGGGNCISTNPTGSRDAWWRVDLQEMSRIKTINITYRQLYPFRLSGFYLYVSNTTAVDNLQNTAYMCYHDDTKDPDLPSFNQSRSCSVNGQYVIFYNKRPADNGPKLVRAYSTTEAVVELCEVQVFGCPINHFGIHCEKTCHCDMSGCDPDTGLCDVRECQSGWMGPTCSEECRSGTFGINCNQTCHCFITGCDSSDGRCTVPGCKTGWQGNSCDKACGTNKFGKDCLETCHCALPGCDRFNGSCTHTGCVSGWTGEACDKVCTTGQFGKDCQQTCHCATPGCDRFSGQCYHTGCDVSWEGPTCDKKCGIGRYGKDCKFKCNCATPGCDASTGNCTVPGCADGWKGSTCDIVCTLGQFGKDCRRTCHCAIPGCDRFSGQCYHTGCDVGWEGPACDKKCGIGRYGKDCEFKCNCATPGCDAITGNCTVPGCADGWKGSTCDIACNSSTFGSNCNNICHCSQPGCDRFTGVCNVTGCVGWKGLACDQAVTFNSKGNEVNSEKSGINAVVGYALLGSLLFISIGFNIAFTIKWLRTKRKESEGSQSGNEKHYQNTVNVNATYDMLDTSKIEPTDKVYDTIAK